jgi:glucose dehydrogenase
MGLGDKGMDAKIARVRARALYHTDFCHPSTKLVGEDRAKTALASIAVRATIPRTMPRQLRRVLSTFGLIAGWMALAHAQDITTKDLHDGLTYSGDYTGQRHGPLTGLTPANVEGLSQWTFQTNVIGKFEATPIDGVLYVTWQSRRAPR